MRNKVLIIAPSRKTRGGITAVIKNYENTSLWKNWNCFWVETYIDRIGILKILYFLRSYILFLFKLPSYYIIHVHLSEPTSALRKSFFIYTAKIFHKKVIIHFHAYSTESTIKGHYKKRYLKLFKKADLIFVLSDYWQNELNEFLKLPSKIKIVYNPCPSVELKKGFDKQNIILYAGTLNKRKGYSDLIKAFSLIIKNNPKWYIVFAGNGEINNANKIAEDLNISDNIIFLDWVSGAEKDKIFNQASIFCLPSYAEGFPMAILDALAYGLPIITTPVGGLNDILINEENALLFQSGDIVTLANHLDRLINDVLLKEKLSSESKLLGKTLFELENIIKNVSIYYKELLNNQ